MCPLQAAADFAAYAAIWADRVTNEVMELLPDELQEASRMAYAEDFIRLDTLSGVDVASLLLRSDPRARVGSLRPEITLDAQSTFCAFRQKSRGYLF